MKKPKTPDQQNQMGISGSAIGETVESNIDNSACVRGTEHPSTSFESLDVGDWVRKSHQMDKTKKTEMLKQCWQPAQGYNFRGDAKDPKRVFKHEWLQQYAPWLAYSKSLKGALCLHCVLFPPVNVQGVLGAFIVKSFDNYKHMHDACKIHASSNWHKTSTKTAKNYLETVSVNVMMISGHARLIEENRQILLTMISIVRFCGTHDLPLRGKDLESGNIFSLNFVNSVTFTLNLNGLL